MPDWNGIVRQRIASVADQHRVVPGLVEELALHLEDRYRELVAGGATADRAYRETISELDDVYPLQADVAASGLVHGDFVPPGESRRGSVVDDLWRDLRYAGRTMRKNPWFVLVVTVILGFGIGANTTVFTVINTLILNPLPVSKPGELAAVALADAGKAVDGGPMQSMSYADLQDYRTRNEVFRSLSGHSSARIVIARIDDRPERLFAELVTADYFDTLGLSPAAGRFFQPDEDLSPGTHAVAVLNHGTWHTRFGGADVIGKTIRVNNIAVTVVGIAPPRFIGVNAIFGPDMWIPASMAEQLLPKEMQHALVDRSKLSFRAIGRLKPGIVAAQAQANIATIASALAREYPDSNEGHTATVRPLRDALFASANSGSAPMLFASAILFAVVAIVLLIACSNVANLLLARSAARQQEMAVRLAMGASRRRLVRQLLTESVCLALLGGVAGLLIAYAGLRLLFGMLPSASNFIAPNLDQSVLMFSVVVSFATGLIFGTVPALKVSQVSLTDTLKDDSRAVGGGRRRVTLTKILLVGQVALSFLLLVLAGLVLRSMKRAYELDPGFQTAHLAVFMTNPGQAGYQESQTKAFYDDVRMRVARMPGVQAVSWASNLPLWSRAATGVSVEGWVPRSRAERISTVLTIVDRNFFETAGVGINRGRAFTDIDRDTSAPVAIVNEKMAQDYWPQGDAIGRRIQLPGESRSRQIVGIARTANYSAWAEAPQNCVYVPLAQSYSDSMILYVRTVADPEQVLLPVEREIDAAAPYMSLGGIGASRTGRQIVDGGLFQARVGVTLLALFGALALGLASVGLCGILAYSVHQRTREIGLRIALGATPSSVRALILSEGMSLVAAGVLLGIVPALGIARLLKTLLFGIGAADPISLAGAVFTLFAVALVACYVPARWATRVDPLVALRQI